MTRASNNAPAIVPVTSPPSLVAKMAGRFGVDPDKLAGTLKATVFRGMKAQNGTYREATNEELMSLLVVADQYRLNPFTKEIYAFPDEKRGGIVPVVSVDGWLRIINEHPQLDAIEYEYGGDADDEDGGPWVECIITRKDRSRPVRVREYLAECRRATGPWDSHPRRMLRWKATIQCGRVAFGFAGIYDQDEAERIVEASVVETMPAAGRGKPRTAPPRALEQVPAESIEPTAEELRAADAALVEQEQRDDG